MEYLANQFYSENYTLDVRSDILSSVVIATGKLNPARPIGKVEEVSEAPQAVDKNEDSVKNWRAVVDARIEQKTRRFSSKPKVILPVVCFKAQNYLSWFCTYLIKKIIKNTLQFRFKSL